MAASSELNVDTPFLQVDLDILEGNIARISDFAKSSGLVLRPHAKTHKCLEIGKLQLASGAVGLTLATVGEAEVFADGGFDDIFIAYPVWPSEQRAARLATLNERIRLSVGVDSIETAKLLGKAVPGLRVLVEVDSGHHRSGCAPEQAGAVATVATKAGLEVAGVFTFPGHSYSPGAASAAAES
ncbi:MAG: alanine racemase, partial [Cryobacterium sp.]|nr:alanine racemase [Cryobacterium sp.]